MNKSTIYFSYWQTKDNLFLNLKRKLNLKKTISQALSDCNIAGGTFSNKVGYWEGSSEPSVEGLFYDVSKAKINKLAKVLKIKLNQDSVLVDSNDQVSFI
jgi:hypothetical protein